MDFSKLAQSPLDGIDDIAVRIKKIEATLISIDNTLKGTTKNRRRTEERNRRELFSK